MRVLDGYEPALPLRFFEDFTRIPHGSGNEGGIADYLVAFAEKRGLFCYRDSLNNVLLRKEASSGRENDPPVILQGHTDMVCEKNGTTSHDFAADPLKLIVKGDVLTADGTTLGADDGVAGAIMLALLDDGTLSHPTLECLFTTGEEVGLDGMRGFDATLLRGRRMINVDSEEEGVATVSCAGGCRTDFDKCVNAEGSVPLFSLSVTGLAGGHSGSDINKGRTNAVKLAAALAGQIDGICLHEISGGCKDNAIPRECRIVFHADESAAGKALVAAAEARSALSAVDAGCVVELTPAGRGAVLSAVDSRQILDLIAAVPSGVIEMDPDIDMPRTSANLGIASLSEGRLRLTVSSRSSLEAKLTETISRLASIGRLAGANVSHRSRYPGWKYTPNSPLQHLYLEIYRAMTGKNGRITGIHAGLECGLMAEKCPDMDMISIGPDMKGIHSPDEELSLSSFDRTYRLIRRMIEA